MLFLRYTLMTQPETEFTPRESPETTFLRELSRVILETEHAQSLLEQRGSTPSVFVEPEDLPVFIDYLRAEAAAMRTVDTLSQHLPEDVRGGGRVLLDIYPRLQTQALYVAEGHLEAEEANPVPCPKTATLNDFAAALLIVARHTNTTITGTYYGTPLVASPDTTVSAITDSFFDGLDHPK